MNIVIVAAHPDDAEYGCGGLVCKAIAAGHKVHILTFTNGDKYGKIPEGASLQEVRESEARDAAAVCGAEVHFLRYRDRELQFNEETLRLTYEYLVKLQAEFVVAHWPADQHPDHQVCGVLATQALLKLPNVGLAYYQATVGAQTFGMNPNRYVDIGDVVDRKMQMIRCHVSQIVDDVVRIHEVTDRWYGANMRVEYAEAYYMHRPTRKSEELFLPK
jgi:LmbE family N-acetylglucosaminyl deacetylase